MNRVQLIATKLFLFFLLFQGAIAKGQTTRDICDLISDSDLLALRMFNVVRIKSFNVIPANKSALEIPIVNQSCDYLADSQDSDALTNKITISVKNLPPKEATAIKDKYRANFLSGYRLPKNESTSTFSDETAECFIVPKFMAHCEGITGRAFISILMFERQDGSTPITQDQALKYFHRLSTQLEMENLTELSPEKLGTWDPNGRMRFERMPDANVRHEK
jgi:hypothetical protein